MSCIRCGADVSAETFRIPVYHHVTASISRAENVGDLCPKCFAHIQRDIRCAPTVPDLVDTAVKLCQSDALSETKKKAVMKIIRTI